jgi:hypothetical protein
MVPDASHPVWVQFVTGQKTIHSTKATLNLLIQRNKMIYERDPSPANVQRLALRSQEFFSRFEKLFADELAMILK